MTEQQERNREVRIAAKAALERERAARKIERAGRNVAAGIASFTYTLSVVSRDHPERNVTKAFETPEEMERDFERTATAGQVLVDEPFQKVVTVRFGDDEVTFFYRVS